MLRRLVLLQDVALWMVDAQNGVRAAFPVGMLVLFGPLMATQGPGKYSLDATWFEGRHPT